MGGNTHWNCGVAVLQYMKTIAVILFAIVLLIPTGCTTTADGRRVPDVVLISAIAQSAASTGTILYLKSHPLDRPKFELARLSLRGLIAAGNGSPADLQAALSSLPISQLSGENGSVIVANAVVILDAAQKKIAELDRAQVWSGFVLPVAQGLLAGLDQALGT